MSDPILSAIEGVKADVRDLKTDLTGRLDQMVTRREMEAEMGTVRAVHQGLADQFERHAQDAEVEHSALRQSLEDDKKARQAERQRVDDQRRADRRFFMTTAIAAVGVAATLVGAIVAIFGN